MDADERNEAVERYLGLLKEDPEAARTFRAAVMEQDPNLSAGLAFADMSVQAVMRLAEESRRKLDVDRIAKALGADEVIPLPGGAPRGPLDMPRVAREVREIQERRMSESSAVPREQETRPRPSP